jgi:transposase
MEQEPRRKRRKFSSEYKAETVRLIQRSGKSIGQMALELGSGETALRRWVDQAEVEAGRGPEGALKRSERRGVRGTQAREPAAADGARNPKKLSDASASPAGPETLKATSLGSAQE